MCAWLSGGVVWEWGWVGGRGKVINSMSSCSASALAILSPFLDEFRLGPELDFPLFFLSPFFDESEQPIPVAFNVSVPDESSGR